MAEEVPPSPKFHEEETGAGRDVFVKLMLPPEQMPVADGVNAAFAGPITILSGTTTESVQPPWLTISVTV